MHLVLDHLGTYTTLHTNTVHFVKAKTYHRILSRLRSFDAAVPGLPIQCRDHRPLQSSKLKKGDFTLKLEIMTYTVGKYPNYNYENDRPIIIPPYPINTISVLTADG